MAGKSNKGRNKGKPLNSNTMNASESNTPPQIGGNSSESCKGDANGVGDSSVTAAAVDGVVNREDGVNKTGPPLKKQEEGEVHLYPVTIKVQSGEKLELKLSPGDSGMDLRHLLLDVPETCFFTCYDLILHSKDGSVHQLEDYSEISETADITDGGCSIEMIAAFYDGRSIRSHVQRARELLSLSNLHLSLSTSLTLKHEKAQQKIADDARVEALELNGLGFMEDITGSLSHLATSSSEEIKCVESIVFSSFNPPPSHRRLVGDLIYLDVVIIEGNQFCITGNTQGFFVNSSTGNILDPKPAKAAYEATTLIGLLQKISSKFKKGFREVLERKATVHPFENVQPLAAANSWLGVYPVPDYGRDAARAENALVLTYGSDLSCAQRDWNEELQSCREFPHETRNERIFRDRVLYKVSCDFVEAAISGAIGVIRRCIPPINPTDPECFHMYVHNNIFFSFALDSDLGQISKDGVLETQITDNEQATYASANNDLKGTKAFQHADVPGLYNLAMAIIDYRGHRIVAQSIIPGILHGDKSDSLLYGSVDNGKKICWNESFHSKVLEAAKQLHLKEHTVLDASGNVLKLAAPVECKGIVGSDDRHYILDLMRTTARDANFDGPGSRFCVLRPELVTSFCQAEAAERSLLISRTKEDLVESHDAKDSSEEAQEKDSECPTVIESCLSAEILLNPNVFTEFKLGGDLEEIAADEACIRKASSYLKTVVLPKFAQDLCTLEISPMDGQTLTDVFHAHGINIRYLGKVAELTKHLPHIWDLCTTEIVVRSAKHIMKEVLRESEDHDLGLAISHLLNCFIGKVFPQSKTQKKDQAGDQSQHKSSKGQIRWSHRAISRKYQPSYTHLTSEDLWSHIQEFSRFKYQFDFPEDARLLVKKVYVIRNLCQKVGISIAARKYDLDAASPFQTSDILDLQPVVKHSVPICSEAMDLMDTGKARLAEGMIEEAFSLFSEAFSILHQVTGPMHREVASCCRYLAMVLYHAGNLEGAIMQQHKELIINERCLGLDHPDTAHSYGNMALFYHGLNQTELALRHMSRTLLLLGLSSGPDHPDVAATFINVAMMYLDIGKMDTALRYLQEALKRNERLLGQEHIQTAICYHALAVAFNCMGAYKLSVQHERKTYDILVKQLGKEDARTLDSENWIKKFQMREVQVNEQKSKAQTTNPTSTQKAIDFLKAFQVATEGSGSGAAANRSINSAIIGEALPRGRGFDERAARAAAEVRKKAAAKGLLVRPGLPNSTMPNLNQLLNMINTANSPDVNESKKGDTTGSTSNGNQLNTPKVNGSAEAQGEKVPVGLGSGLVSLDSKKQKPKSKCMDPKEQ
ncbi:hypothetical protein J5N97_006496 [Dioscorea zingiberensis]|uniref:Clu domain-containing protein n=1 Tax=Dioscorea zingiberensis TaxID=325984 RepID=A0A9D5HST1_9LILI|nr:hypothetical protein J5N97_006496 [Dioscorea zingiberensis]